MEFQLPKITKPLDLGVYDERLRGQVLHVWVNPNKEFKQYRLWLLREYAWYISKDVDNLLKKRRTRWQNFKHSLFLFVAKYYLKQAKISLDERRDAWFARLWSQHEDKDTHCAVEEVERLSMEEPALFEWLMKESVLLLDGFAADKKK